jgi:hypothetical protein
MSTSHFIRDLYLLQEITNCGFESGSDLVTKTAISSLFSHSLSDPDGKIDWDTIVSNLESWESEGYIKILTDPRKCKAKDYCFQTLRNITAVSAPADSRED